MKKRTGFLIVFAVATLVIALCSCSISSEPEVISTDGELLSLLGVKGVKEIYDLEFVQESTEDYDCTEISFKASADYESFLEKNYGEPEDGSDGVGSFEPNEVSKDIFENSTKDISFDDVLNCGTIFNGYTVKLKGDIVKSNTTIATYWYSVLDKNGEYLWLTCSVPQLIEVQIEPKGKPLDNTISDKEINSADELLNLLGFEESFEIYDIRYSQSSDEYDSTSIFFKTDADYVEVAKKHCGYYEDYFDYEDPDALASEQIHFNNIQKMLPEDEQIPFEFVVKHDVLFKGYTIKGSEYVVSETTNSTNWYLIDDGEKEYLWIENTIPEIIDIKIDEAENISK